MILTETIMHCSTTCFSPATVHDHDQGGYKIGAASDGLYGYDHALPAPPASALQQHMTITKEGYEPFVGQELHYKFITKMYAKTSQRVVKYARKFSENFAKMPPYGGDHLLQTCNTNLHYLLFFIKS